MPQARVNDVDLFYEEFGAGDPLLLIHGMMETGRTYAKVALSLCNSYRVIVPDLRGYGRSRPPQRTFPPDFYARDAADLAALLRALQITGARVIGAGDGGEVALLLAIQAPGLVRSVVAIDVTGAFPQALLAVLPRIGAWANDPNTVMLARRSNAIREYGVEGMQGIWAGWKAAVRAIIAAGGDISLRQAGQIACPTLIINQAGDALNTPEMTNALVQAIPQADLRLLRNVDTRAYDTHRYWLNDEVMRWLAEH